MSDRQIGNPDEKPLHEVIHEFAEKLAQELGHESHISGIAEIGSYAKHEAVSTSDHDMRVYVTQPQSYAWQIGGGRFRESRNKEMDERYAAFIREVGNLPRVEYVWDEFNAPVADRLSQDLNCTVEFGICDVRFAKYEFSTLDHAPTVEHQILVRSDIVYDPDGELLALKRSLEGKQFPALTELYTNRYLSPPFELYTHLEPEKHDEEKMRKSGQIQWVKWAVCAIRDAVWAQEYLRKGKNIYRKEDVLSFIDRELPQHASWIREIYSWKTNELIRDILVRDFLENPALSFERFRSYLPRIELFYEDLRKLHYPAP